MAFEGVEETVAFPRICGVSRDRRATFARYPARPSITAVENVCLRWRGMPTDRYHGRPPGRPRYRPPSPYIYRTIPYNRDRPGQPNPAPWPPGQRPGIMGTDGRRRHQRRERHHLAQARPTCSCPCFRIIFNHIEEEYKEPESQSSGCIMCM